ncbi:MAG TPA: chemotaxis protein CheA [Bryobacteraceae bacterium]|nr:chemotaxis protein CheA [Bryobacteraceae bacterium]
MSKAADESALERYRTAFAEEAHELLGELERSLLELEKTPDDPEPIGRAFRALHTIKGSGAMFGFDAIASFCHEVETIFDEVRAGRIAVTPALIGAALAAKDHIQSLLAVSGAGDAASLEAGQQILDRLRRATSAPLQAAPVEPAEGEGSDGILANYRVRFDPHPDIFLSGTNPIPLLQELRALGECSVVAHLERTPTLDRFNCEECYSHWDAVLTTSAGENAVRDLFIFVEDRADLTIDRIDDTQGERRRLGEILVERGDISAKAVEECLATRPLAGELLVQAGLVPQDRVTAAVLEQQHLDTVRAKQGRSETASTLRVPAARLDSMVDTVGELVTVQARLSSYALASGDSEINFIAEEVERLTEMLRESAMSLRMLPIGDTFSRFRRLVRDLSSELGKKVELSTDGNDTELDKTVIEQLSDPLVHLIRNALDHGIETPEQRLAAGKPEIGRVHLSACHAGGFVLIRISDDGAGMNRDAIRARAIERGLIRPDAALSDEAIFALTLQPGFSTAARVTGVSGRGVGMDVVQRGVDLLRGTLSISSQPGAGTTVTLRIPLTLAIIDGLLIEAGGAFFVVPLSNISECVELVRDRAVSGGRPSLVNVRGELIPCIALRERFDIAGEPPNIEQVIVAETREGRFGLVVDRVIGDHHTVIKKLGHLYRRVEEVSGATILGDGTVALILDIDRIAFEVIREYAGAPASCVR